MALSYHGVTALAAKPEGVPLGTWWGHWEMQEILPPRFPTCPTPSSQTHASNIAGI